MPPYPPFVFNLVQQHGRHSLAYSILQPSMLYFGDPVRGVIAYRQFLGQHTVLADPVCAAEDAARLVHDFVAAHPNALFMQVRRASCDVLRPLGYYVTPVGVENEIEVCGYTLAGKKKRDLRHYRNKAIAGNVVVQEEVDSDGLRHELKPVSDSWLPLKSWRAKELEFLARPYLLEPEPGVRIFTGRIDGIVAGFVLLDPIYNHGRAIGYTVTILRHLPTSPEGTVDYINLHVIEQLCAEGVPMLSLGVSPFHHMQRLAADEGKGALPVYWMYRALHRWGDPIYHFRGLSFHKCRYRAYEVPVYTAVRSATGLLPLYAAAHNCRMI